MSQLNDAIAAAMLDADEQKAEWERFMRQERVPRGRIIG